MAECHNPCLLRATHSYLLPSPRALVNIWLKAAESCTEPSHLETTFVNDSCALHTAITLHESPYGRRTNAPPRLDS